MLRPRSIGIGVDVAGDGDAEDTILHMKCSCSISEQISNAFVADVSQSYGAAA